METYSDFDREITSDNVSYVRFGLVFSLEIQHFSKTPESPCKPAAETRLAAQSSHLSPRGELQRRSEKSKTNRNRKSKSIHSEKHS